MRHPSQTALLPVLTLSTVGATSTPRYCRGPAVIIIITITISISISNNITITIIITILQKKMINLHPAVNLQDPEN